METTPTQGDRRELRPLTGIRGVAAAMVVLFHFRASWLLLLPSLHWIIPFAAQGYLGVDLFFVLSGFILSYVHHAGQGNLGWGDYARFLWLRVARLAPNHYATLFVLGVGLVLAKPLGFYFQGEGVYPVSGIPGQLALIHAWPIVGSKGWNDPSWSTSAEWFAYLCIFPLVCRLLKLRLGQVAAIAVGYCALALWIFVLNPALPSAWLSLARVSCEFLAGGLTFRVYQLGGSATCFCQRYTTAIFIMIVAGLLLIPQGFPGAPALAILGCPALILGLTAGTSRVSQILSIPLAVWLGRVSYAIYMCHAIVQKILTAALPAKRFVHAPLAVRLLLPLVAIALILGSAAALYYVVEEPSRRFLRRFATKSPAAILDNKQHVRPTQTAS